MPRIDEEGRSDWRRTDHSAAGYAYTPLIRPKPNSASYHPRLLRRLVVTIERNISPSMNNPA